MTTYVYTYWMKREGTVSVGKGADVEGFVRTHCMPKDGAVLHSIVVQGRTDTDDIPCGECKRIREKSVFTVAEPPVPEPTPNAA